MIRNHKAKRSHNHYCGNECLAQGFARRGVTGSSIAKTNVKKYGHENVFAADAIKTKIVSTMVERYGVERPAQNGTLKEKQFETTRARYGMRSVLSLKEIHALGVAKAATHEIRDAIDWSSVIQKQHITKKINGTFRRLKIEEQFFNYLLEHFDKIEHPVVVNSWEIDFYVPSIDVYIQFDGVYWHGLDRSIEDVCKFRAPRDKVIYETYCRDRVQDEWFAANHLRLVRVTDQEFKRGDRVSFD